MVRVKITKEKFKSYCAIRKSGVCSMKDVKAALFWLNNSEHLCERDSVGHNLAHLTENEYKEILFNYGKYQKKFNS